ncbi:MAG: hypothetical protein GY898_05080 [Proteobacteria bacterium]|nr:hypothetical protein [Pseudomonadota bacterium]
MLALLCNGYEYGVADHGTHVAFLDPGPWVGDLLAHAARAHPSLLWMLPAPGPRAAGLLHLAVLFATGWALMRLMAALEADEAAPLVLLVGAVAWPVVGGVDTLDPLLLPRGVALPMELLAVSWLLAGRSTAAFALVGAALCVHAPSAVACAAGMAAAAAPERDPRQATRNTGAFLLGASPVVLLWIATGGPSQPIVDELWARLIYLRAGHHLDPAVWPIRDFVVTGVFLAAGFAFARRAEVRWFLVGTVVYGTVGVALGLAGSSLALQLEPAQAARLVVVVGGAAAVARIRRPCNVGVGLACLLAAAAIGRWSPDGDRAHFHPTGSPGPEQELARELANLPVDSLVMVPPHRFDSVRVVARRAIFVTWKDGGEGLFDRSVALEWKRRIEVACACLPLDEPLIADRRPGARGAELRRRMEAGIRAASPEQLIAAARSEGVTHVVFERGDGFEVVPVD